MGMPVEIKIAISDHADAQWSVQHTVDNNGKYTDIYKANGKSVFSLTWWSLLSKPSWKIL